MKSTTAYDDQFAPEPIQEIEQEHHDKIVGIMAEKIEAERRPAPHGWKLVPVEPTPEMIQAAMDAETVSEMWGEILAVAPTPPAQASGQSAAPKPTGIAYELALVLSDPDSKLSDEAERAIAFAVAALRAQPAAATAAPSDEEIDAIAASMPDGAGGMLKQWGYRQFARALLARYGRQQVESAEPAAQAPAADAQQEMVNRMLDASRASLDTAMLDWIEDAWFYRDGRGELTFAFNECWSAGNYPSLRAAIQAAMQRESGGGV